MSILSCYCMSTTIKTIYAVMMGTIKQNFWKIEKQNMTKTKWLYQWAAVAILLKPLCLTNICAVDREQLKQEEESWWLFTFSYLFIQKIICYLHQLGRNSAVDLFSTKNTCVHTCAKCAHHFKFSLKNVYAVKSCSQDIFNLPNSYIKDQKQEDIPLMSKYI